MSAVVLADSFSPDEVIIAAAVFAAATAAGTVGDGSCRCGGIGVVARELAVAGCRMCLKGGRTPFMRIQFTEILKRNSVKSESVESLAAY